MSLIRQRRQQQIPFGDDNQKSKGNCNCDSEEVAKAGVEWFSTPDLWLVDDEGDGFCVDGGATGCGDGVGVGSGWGSLWVGGWSAAAAGGRDADGEQEGEESGAAYGESADASAARGEEHQETGHCEGEGCDPA